MLAMEDQAPRGIRPPVSSLTTIASKLAPTGFAVILQRVGDLQTLQEHFKKRRQ